MASKIHRDGTPNLSVEQIEKEIERMTAEGELTERWMSGRAKRKMDTMSEKDEAVRQAFVAGYRMGADTQFLAPIVGLLVALVIIQVAALLTGNGWVLFSGWAN